MAKRPGGEFATRPLHFVWIADVSGSMRLDGKIQALNTAVREAVPFMRDSASENPNAQVLVRVVTFSDGARWQVATPTPVEDFAWTDLEADGVTDLGKALELVAEQLKMPPMESRALPPVLVLVSDGQPTDDFKGGLRKLMEQPWGKRAIRLAIAIGGDADREVLQQFIGHPEIKVLEANDPDSLTRHIHWVSTVVVASASAPRAEAAVPGAEGEADAAAAGASAPGTAGTTPATPPPPPVPIPEPLDGGGGDAGPGSVW